MKLRQLPPAAAPLAIADLSSAVAGLVRGDAALERLTADLGKALGVRHVFLVSSGRAALTLILRALARLSPDRREVILPAYTCFSVPAAVTRAGLKITLCDIDATGFDFDYRALEKLLAETRPLCVVSTHLFGFKADTPRTTALCRPHGVFVVDDAAQALGIARDGQPLGTFGDAGFYSFGRGKAVTSVSGGAVVTNSSQVGEAIASEYARLERPSLARRLRTIAEALTLTVLIRPALYWMPASLPFLHLGETSYSPGFALERMSGVEAGLLRRWQRRLADSAGARSRHVAAFARVMTVPVEQGPPPSIRLPLVCASQAVRDGLLEVSRRKRLGLSLMYPTAVDAIPELRGSLDGRRFPNAERMAERLLTVPVHPLVSREDRETIERVLTDAAVAPCA